MCEQEVAPLPVPVDRHSEDSHRAWPSHQGCYCSRRHQHGVPDKVQVEHQRGGERRSGSASNSTLIAPEYRTWRPSPELMMPAHGPSGPCRSTLYSGELRGLPCARLLNPRHIAYVSVSTCALHCCRQEREPRQQRPLHRPLPAEPVPAEGPPQLAPGRVQLDGRHGPALGGAAIGVTAPAPC